VIVLFVKYNLGDIVVHDTNGLYLSRMQRIILSIKLYQSRHIGSKVAAGTGC